MSKKISEYANTNDKRIFFICSECSLIFLRPDLRLNPEEEKKRYDLHQNDIHDSGYQKFLMPIVDIVTERYLPSAAGLDFGSGPSSGLSHLLERKGYTVNQYDPFYRNDENILKQSYDYILCCEVLEHIFDPQKELSRLRNLMKPKGALIIMTQLWKNLMPFKEWYYQRDATHICFYSKETFNWIKTNLKFKELEIKSDNLIILR